MKRKSSGLRLTDAGRQRLRDELEELRVQIDSFEARLKEELEHRDDLNWYVTYQELAVLRRRAAVLESSLQDDSAVREAAPDGVVRTAGEVRGRPSRNGGRGREAGRGVSSSRHGGHE